MVRCLYHPPSPPAPDPMLDLPAVCEDRSRAQVRLGDYGLHDPGEVPRYGAETSPALPDPEPARLVPHPLRRLDSLRDLHARDGAQRRDLESLDPCRPTHPLHPSSDSVLALVLVPLHSLLSYTCSSGHDGRGEETEIVPTQLEPAEWVSANFRNFGSGTHWNRMRTSKCKYKRI